MDRHQELTITYSAPFLREGEKTICVYFERGTSDYAEGVIPNAKILKSAGFTQEELEQLTVYLQENTTDIMNKAKNINFLNNWLRK